MPSPRPLTSCGHALSTVEPEDHAAAAAYLMKHARATALVVVDNEHAKRPLGLITEADIVRAVADTEDLEEIRIRDLMTRDPRPSSREIRAPATRPSPC